jgi:hypothetical protein
VKKTENERHAFILRIWREPREIHGAAPQWRGKIENAANPREQRFLKDLGEIISFLSPYIERMGVEVSKPRKQINRTKSLRFPFFRMF